MARIKQAPRRHHVAHKKVRQRDLKATRPEVHKAVVKRVRAPRDPAAAGPARDPDETADEENAEDTASESEPEPEPVAAAGVEPEPGAAAATAAGATEAEVLAKLPENIRVRCEKLLKRFRATRRLAEHHKAFLVKHGLKKWLRKPPRARHGMAAKRLGRRLQKRVGNLFAEKSFERALKQLLWRSDNTPVFMRPDARWDIQTVVEQHAHAIVRSAVENCALMNPERVTLQPAHVMAAANQYFKAMPGPASLAWIESKRKAREAEEKALNAAGGKARGARAAR
jgi:hypothetical protein